MQKSSVEFLNLFLKHHPLEYLFFTESTETKWNKQRVLMHGHQGWNVRHGLCHIYMMVCVVYCGGKWQGWVNSVPELELQLNSNSNSGIGIGIGGIENGIGIEDSGIGIENRNWFFLQLLPQHLLVNQQFPNFSFNRGHNLPCDWLLMQQGCFKFLEHCPPAVWSQKTHEEGTLFPLGRQLSEGLKMVTINMINISLPPWTKTKLLSLLNKIKWMISGLEVKLSQSTSFSRILLIGIFRFL